MPDDAPRRLRIGIVGIRGVPARYGGFETAVEEVGRRLAGRGHEVFVYCRTDTGVPRLDSYLGMRLVHLGAVRQRTLETISHTGLSVGHMLTRGPRPDVALVLNAANSPWLAGLRAAGVPMAVHVDGLEWKRAKWGPTGRRYYRMAESLAVRWADALVADARGIADYYLAEFGAPTELIAYGAPKISPCADRLGEVGVAPRRYHLVVARFEPENNVETIVRGYVASGARLPLVVVGGAPYARDYISRVHGLADRRVLLTGPIWDNDLLDQLYANALTYVHGHSVGGTNPSLLRAIGAGTPCLAFDVGFNREVLDDAGRYFTTPADVAVEIERAEADPQAQLRRRVLLQECAARYDWDDVTDKYEALFRRLAETGPRRDRPSGVRAGVDESELLAFRGRPVARGPVSPLVPAVDPLTPVDPTLDRVAQGAGRTGA